MEHKVRPYKSRIIWSNDDENILVEMWNQRISDFRGTKKNGQIYREMAIELQREGLKLTDADVKTKINNMTSKYKKELVSGEFPSSWRLFEKIHQILGNNSNDSAAYSEDSIQINTDHIKLENGALDCPLELPQTSRQHAPSLSSAAEFILPTSPIPSPSASPQHACNKDKFNFQKQLLSSINEFRQEFKVGMHKLHEADAQLIALEKEKVILLRKQVSDAAELKDGVLKLLAEIGSSIKKE